MAVEDAERTLAGDDDVQAPVVEALGDLGDPGLAADSPRPDVRVAEDDPERLALVEAVADHRLVALLEDVERHELTGQQHQRQLEDRDLDGLFRHRGESRQQAE